MTLPSNGGLECGEETSSFLVSSGNPPLGDRKTKVNYWLLVFVGAIACSITFAITDVSNARKRSNEACPPIISFRRDIAAAALEIMHDDTAQAAAKSNLVDIGKLVDIVNEALDTVGVRGVYEQLFGTTELVVAFNDAAREKGLDKFKAKLMMGHQGIRPFYAGVPNDRDFGDLSVGSIWWLRHWLGAMTADKLLRDGSLRLGPDNDDRIYDAPTLFDEYRVMQRVPFPDILSYHAQHGFAWHFITMTRPNMIKYPTDLLGLLCPDLWDVDEYVKVVNNDVARECRHAIGHGVYYVLAARQLNIQKQFTVREQLRHGVGFYLKNEAICEGYKVCGQAPTERAQIDCIAGLKHSLWLFDVGNFDKSQQPIHPDLCNG